MPGTIVLVRHGESESNAERRFTETPEVPLTELGREQATRVARWIADRLAPRRLLSSPFRRAHETAEIIGRVLGLEVEIVPDLREQDLGELHGRPYGEAADTAGFDERALGAWRPPGGESQGEVQQRAGAAVRALAAAHPESEIVAVAHGGTMRAVWAECANGWRATESIPNCAILLLPHDGERFGPPELLVLI